MMMLDVMEGQESEEEEDPDEDEAAVVPLQVPVFLMLLRGCSACLSPTIFSGTFLF
jgi:hypothetical protein